MVRNQKIIVDIGGFTKSFDYAAPHNGVVKIAILKPLAMACSSRSLIGPSSATCSYVQCMFTHLNIDGIPVFEPLP